MQQPVYRWRLLEESLRRPTSRGKVRLILGARQTGKSWLVRRLTPDGAIVVDLQDVRERLRYERSPGLLVDELVGRSAKRVTVCVDEIQKVPRLLDEVQHLVDRYPGRFDMFLTGSSARRLRAGAANLLPGRAHVYSLFPVVLPEREGGAAEAALALPTGNATAPRFPAVEIEDLLLWGGLPGIAAESKERRRATLDGYAELYLEEEIRREAVVRDLGAFARFLELAALESGTVMNLTGLSQESGVPVATLRSYYQVLEDSFVGHWVPAYSKPGRKRLLTTPKFYFFDTGVRNAAARLPLEPGLLKTQAGTLFENWVLTELVHRASYLGRTTRVSFWRTVDGAEVDAVVETPREDIAFEAKWTENPRAADARHVELFLDAYPRRARRGFVVCRCPRSRRLTDRVTAIPWRSL